MASTTQQLPHTDKPKSSDFVDLTWVERIWKTAILTGYDGELGIELQVNLHSLNALACGFTRAVLYRGHRIECDVLIQAAAEQVASMDAIRAFTDRSACIYINLSPSHNFLYMRQIMLNDSAGILDVSASKPIYFVALGPQNAVRDVSEYLNAVIDRELAEQAAY